jgi:hypothetical protein
LNVSFNNNVFYCPLGENEIYFEFANKEISGIKAFDTYTGGKNYFGKVNFNKDYSLSENSYGIDIGDNGVSADMGKLTDLSGNKRIVNTIDVGAFEYQIEE